MGNSVDDYVICLILWNCWSRFNILLWSFLNGDILYILYFFLCLFYCGLLFDRWNLFYCVLHCKIVLFSLKSLIVINFEYSVKVWKAIVIGFGVGVFTLLFTQIYIFLLSDCSCFCRHFQDWIYLIFLCYIICLIVISLVNVLSTWVSTRMLWIPFS